MCFCKEKKKIVWLVMVVGANQYLIRQNVTKSVIFFSFFVFVHHIQLAKEGSMLEKILPERFLIQGSVPCLFWMKC